MESGQVSIYNYEPMTGENVSMTAERMVALAKETKGSVRALFSGVIPLIATEDSTPEGIVADLLNKFEEADKTYLHSPEGKSEALESEKAEQEYNDLMVQLPNIDFNNQEAVLDWICNLEEASKNIDVDMRQDDVLKIFAEHGYQPSVNSGKEFNGEDRDNYARYIVGQALAGLQDDDAAILPIVTKYTDDWKKKFPA